MWSIAISNGVVFPCVDNQAAVPLQVLIEGKPGQTGDELERQLFIVRKLVEKAKAAAMGAAAEDFYLCTLSNRTIVYKVSVTQGQSHRYQHHSVVP